MMRGSLSFAVDGWIVERAVVGKDDSMIHIQYTYIIIQACLLQKIFMYNTPVSGISLGQLCH